MLRYFIILSSLNLIVASCNLNTNNSEVTEKKISLAEQELFSGDITSPDIEKAKVLVSMYIEFANLHPKDSISVEYLFKAADISMNFGAAKKTIGIFNRMINEYPEYRNISTVYFLKGFVYEDQLRDYQMAKNCYMEYIEKYPNSVFADDALISLQNLGKSPDELIEEFERNSQ